MKLVSQVVNIANDQGVFALVKRVYSYCLLLASRFYHRNKLKLSNTSFVELGTSAGFNVYIDYNYKVLSNRILSELGMGKYGGTTADVLQTFLKDDIPLIELGSGIGYTATVASKLMKDDIDIFAVEPNANMIPILKRTRELNVVNFVIMNKAYGKSNDWVQLNIAQDFWSSSTSGRESDAVMTDIVETVSISDIVSTNDIDEFQLFANAEGVEYELIDEEFELLNDKCKFLIISFHEDFDNNPIKYQKHLIENGFECVYENSNSHLVVFENSN